MEMKKVYFLGLASLGLFACSNEEVINEPAAVAVSGPAALTIQINNPGMSRTTTTGTTEETKAITVKNLIVKYLPSNTYAKLDNLTLTNGQDQTLYDVPEGTTGFVVVGNSLAASAEEVAFSSTSDAETNTKEDKSAAAATVYGMTTTLTATGEVINGTGETNEGKANTTYSKYTANVTVRPVTARMEISGLKFAPNQTSAFSSLTLEGVFLNDYYNNGAFTADGSAEKVTATGEKVMTDTPDLSESATTPETALGETFKLADWFATNPGSDETGLSFYDGSQTPTLPSGSDVWAYNFFVDKDNAAHSLPRFTVVVNPTYAGESAGYGAPLYAVISQYKDSQNTPITKFEAGKIYKITSLNLPEDVLTPDINGNQTIAITATVTVEDWVIEQTTGVWEGQVQN